MRAVEADQCFNGLKIPEEYNNNNKNNKNNNNNNNNNFQGTQGGLGAGRVKEGWSRRGGVF